MPRVAFHCDVCDHELEHHCPACRDLDESRQREAHHAEHEDDKRRADAMRALTVATPGASDLEEALGVEVFVEFDGPDEDGDPCYAARARYLADAESRSFGPTAEEAVKALRRELIQETRAMLAALEAEAD